MSHLPRGRFALLRLFRPLVTLASNIQRRFQSLLHTGFNSRLNIPVICVGRFRTRATMVAAIANELRGAVSKGRPFLADLLVYAHTRDSTPGQGGNACTGHPGTRPRSETPRTHDRISRLIWPDDAAFSRQRVPLQRFRTPTKYVGVPAGSLSSVHASLFFDMLVQADGK